LENTEENCEMIWKIWKKVNRIVVRYRRYGRKTSWNSEKFWEIQKKSKLNSEKIGKIWKKPKLNSEKIWKIQKKI
jgi:hypothetical protein